MHLAAAAERATHKRRGNSRRQQRHMHTIWLHRRPADVLVRRSAGEPARTSDSKTQQNQSTPEQRRANLRPLICVGRGRGSDRIGWDRVESSRRLARPLSRQTARGIINFAPSRCTSAAGSILQHLLSARSHAYYPLLRLLRLRFSVSPLRRGPLFSCSRRAQHTCAPSGLCRRSGRSSSGSHYLRRIGRPSSAKSQEPRRRRRH